VNFLQHPSDKVLLAALRSVGNIATGNDEQTQRLLDADILHRLDPLLCHIKPRVNKECIWLISNITAGTTEQVQVVLDSGLLKKVVLMLDVGDFAVQRVRLGYWGVDLHSLTVSGMHLGAVERGGERNFLASDVPGGERRAGGLLQDARQARLGALRSDPRRPLPHPLEVGRTAGARDADDRRVRW